ncbi:MAG: Uma2 family endonuclease [Bacteroidetes bacterium QH_9_67_14]|nr:MAG: Uma2 family endonuclease [Bacteroidetes bacterium QH_9_67_14]
MPATATKKATAAGGERPGAEAWSKAMRDLPDLPYKVETNARGQLILSPPKPEHGFSQSRISRRIFEALGEVVGVEFSVYTSGGVKIPDVVWMSEERRARIPEGAEASPVVPELCVEVMSDSNTEAERAEKRDLYFDGGAKEVWVVGRDDAVRFFDADSEIEQSRLAPDFPSRI